jgi:hypothetical protein
VLEAAIVLALHLSAAFIIAGVLACGAAAIAYHEGQLRRDGRASDLGSLLTTVLAVSSVMMLILAVAGYGRRLTLVAPPLPGEPAAPLPPSRPHGWRDSRFDPWRFGVSVHIGR